MLLYHGSNLEIEAPRLLKNQRNLDFGRGFYTTSDYKQAVSWAQRTARIRNEGKACVSYYEIEEIALDKLKILRFDKADNEWLDFVAANRKGNAPQDDWDLIIGPVANDQTFPTILLYLDGYLDAESTIKRLLTQKLSDQFTFKTELALSNLRFIKAENVWKK